jgi:hypothetical protein
MTQVLDLDKLQKSLKLTEYLKKIGVIPKRYLLDSPHRKRMKGATWKTNM